MKKVILSLLVLVFVSGSVAHAALTNTVVSVYQEDKVKIQEDTLPEAVKKTLKGAEYKGWTVSAAYLIKSADQYEIELKKGAETKTVKLDKEGKVI
jgi:hypothetical protein